MGMKEDRLSWAAGLAGHAQRMFDETGNAYFVVAAIAGARSVKCEVPDWALNILLDAVNTAYWTSEDGHTALSLDKALGLKTTRGGVPLRKSGIKAIVEGSVFNMVRAIHQSFDVSIPTACEHAYYAIDDEFAEEMHELLQQGEVAEETLTKIGLTRSDWEVMTARDDERRCELRAHGDNNAEVSAKLRMNAWWRITRGDRLGYSLDRLIDKYHRVGKKPARSVPEAIDQQLLDFFAAVKLLISPEKCTRAAAGGTGEAKSSLAGVPHRPEFASFYAMVVGRKRRLSEQ